MLSAGCSHARSSRGERPDLDPAISPYGPPVAASRIASPEVTESSGIAVSRCQPNVFWTHNDSGDNAFIYAFDASGNDLGTWRVRGADNRDWEDIASFRDASGQCYLYIGDIGNNEGKRDRTIVYRVKEPEVTTESSRSNRQDPLTTEPAESISVNYPGPRPNAEALLVHPKTGDIYIVTKRVDGPASVFKTAPVFGSTVVAEKVAEVAVPAVPNGFITGGDISPDSTRLVLCDYAAGYEFVLPAGSASFDEIWKQTPVRFDIGGRKIGESIAYSADGSSLFATSEGTRPPIFETRRR